MSVPYGAGGAVDLVARGLATELAKVWGQSVVVENKPGANEMIAASEVSRAKADGYTILVATEAALTLNPHLYKKLSYDVIRDFEPVSRLVLVPQVFTVPKSSPANDLHEFIKYAKASDGSLNFGSSGQGGITHLPMVMLMHNEDFTMTHIPYKGGAQVVVEALAERIDATIVTVSSVQQHINSGALKGLAVSSPTRLPALPNVPTFDELGIKDVNAVFNIGLAVPKGTPAEIIEKIASDSREILSNPEFQKQYLNPYSYLVVGSTPEEFKTWIEEDLKEQGERITISGASLD